MAGGAKNGSTASTAAPMVLLDGLALVESPRWREGRLWFCDWIAGEVVAVDLTGRRETILKMSSFPFSIDWLPDGRLLIVNEKRILRREPDGVLKQHADLSALSEKNFNEIVVDARGLAYVNCVNFDFPGGEFRPGLIAAVAPDGAARIVADGLAFPNGMAISPDGATLVVAESYGKKLTAFARAPDGGLGPGRLFADLGGDYPDGLCFDAEDAVWYADVPNKHCVRVQEGGEVLQTIPIDRGCFSCALGGVDGKTLFIAAATWTGAPAQGGRTGQIVAVPAPAPHAGWP
jgi:sugar lactone lactonase YvrE